MCLFVTCKISCLISAEALFLVPHVTKRKKYKMLPFLCFSGWRRYWGCSARSGSSSADTAETGMVLFLDSVFPWTYGLAIKNNTLGVCLQLRRTLVHVVTWSGYHQQDKWVFPTKIYQKQRVKNSCKTCFKSVLCYACTVIGLFLIL